jgi:hypothetical protein
LSIDVEGQGLLERRGERHDAVLGPLALGDADAAGVEVDVGDADPDQFGHPHAREQQGLDQHDVLTPPTGPHHLVVAAVLGLGEDVGQPLRLPLHVHLQLGARRCRNTALR